MDKITHCINHNRFITIDTEELSALELIGKTVEKTNEVVEKSNNHEDRIANNERKKVSFDDMKEKFKFDNNFSDIDYRGKWFGLDEPTLSDEGMRSQVQKNRDDIIKTNEQLETIETEIKSEIVNIHSLQKDLTVDCSDMVISCVSQRGKILDLKGETVIIEKPIQMGVYSRIINGNINFKLSGCILMNDYCKLLNLNMEKLQGFTEKFFIKSVRSHCEINGIKFKSQAIWASAIELKSDSTLTNKFIWDVKIKNLLTEYCSGILIEDIGDFITFVDIDSCSFMCIDYGIKINKVSKQISHFNISNIRLQNVPESNANSVGIYINCAWSNFSNIASFNDGASTFKCIEFKKLDTTQILYAIRNNLCCNFTNLNIEGQLVTNGAYFLHNFNNVLMGVNNQGLTNGTTGVDFFNLNCDIKTVDELKNETILKPSKTAYDNFQNVIKITREGKTGVISNIRTDADYWYEALIKLSPEVIEGMLNGKYFANYMLCSENLSAECKLAIGKEEANAITDIINIGSSPLITGYTTKKGSIRASVFEMSDDIKTLIRTRPTGTGIYIRFNFPNIARNQVVKIYDFKSYPYLTPMLNNNTEEWFNNYIPNIF